MFDFLFIGEHWYQHHESRLANPLVYCSTSLPLQSSKTPSPGRQHGGIYLLVKPHIRSLIQSTSCSTYSISVSIPGFRFAAVYYPPYSISEETLTTNISELGPLYLLLGDINTKFASTSFSATRRSKSTLSPRSIFFQKWSANTNMLHICDPSKETISCHIPDHAFAKSHIKSKITLALVSTPALGVCTDHQHLLHIQYSSQNSNSPSVPLTQLPPLPSIIPNRFHIQRLRNPDIVRQYHQTWTMMETLFTSFKQSESYDVDMLDYLLCSAVQAVAASVLSTYKPEECRKMDDKIANRLATEFDIPASIQLIKRTQHSSSVGVQLVSSTSMSTPMEECVNHYSKVFNGILAHSHPLYKFHLLTDLPFLSTVQSSPSRVSEDSSIPFLYDENILVASRLLDQISTEKLCSQLDRMSTTTACGIDGITVIMLRHLLDTPFTDHLCQLYRACLYKGQTPLRWDHALVFSLCKDKTKPYTAINSHPISLVCLFRKLFESLILPIVASSGDMSYSGIQAGIRSGYSTLTHVLTLHHQIEADAGTNIVVLDFVSAFDKVDRTHLYANLQHQGMNSLVLHLIHQLMYRDMTFSILVNRCESPLQSRNCGLLQGSPLSPILFNRFINSLLQTRNLQTPASFPSALFVADDGVLISPTFSKAQALLNQAFNWADKHGMSFNIPKCGYLLTHTAPKSMDPPVLVLNNQPIPFVDSYRYLGVMFSSTGIDFLAQGNLLSLRVENLLSAMRWYSTTWSPRIRLNLFKTVILPSLEYSVPLLYAQLLRNRKSESWIAINNTYNNCLTWIAGGNANRPHITSHLLGLLPFGDRAQQLFTRFYLHLMAMNLLNPLRTILDRHCWYPKSHHHMPVNKSNPLLFQFLNPPPAVECHVSNLQARPISLLHDKILPELSLQTFNQIHSTIGPHSPKLLQVSMVLDRVSGPDFDVVLTAPATDQARFLGWRRGIFGWGRKCLCGDRFDRGHTTCMPYPDPGLTEEQLFIYNLDRCLLDSSTKYTIMDFLLNQRLWTQARTILDSWTLTMSTLLKAKPSPD